METQMEMDSEDQEECTVFAYLLSDGKGNLYATEVEDMSEVALILSVQPELIAAGIFQEKYIDCRYLDEMGFTLIRVLQMPDPTQ